MLSILLLVFTIVNWIIYHKIFKVYYLGSISKGIWKETVVCFFVAGVETAIVMIAGQWILGIIFAIAMIIGIYFAVREMIKTFKQAKDLVAKNKKKNTEEDVPNEEDSTTMEEEDTGINPEIVDERQKENDEEIEAKSNQELALDVNKQDSEEVISNVVEDVKENDNVEVAPQIERKKEETEDEINNAAVDKKTIPWYLSSIFITLLFLSSLVFGVTAILAIILLIIRVKKYGKKKDV